jgi:HEAT repeat protein
MTTRPAAAPEARPTHMLRSTDPCERRQAALRLRGCREATLVLLAQARAEQDPAVRDAIFRALTSLDRPEVVAGIAELLRLPDDGVRADAQKALARMDASRAALPDFLRDPDPRVRARVASVLADMSARERPAA